MQQVRHAFFDRIFERIDNGEDIYIVSADRTGYYKFDEFIEKHPKLFVPVGIAEMNLVEVTTGLSLAGKKAIALSPVPFPVLRALDQIRNAACLHNNNDNNNNSNNRNNNALIAQVGDNVSNFGVTHFNTEYISLLRTLTGLRLINVTDATIAEKLADMFFLSGRVNFANFDPDCVERLYQPENIDFDDGIGVLREGTDIALVSCGYDSARCIRIADELRESGINCKVIDVYALPYDENSLISALHGINKVITIEENVRYGGLGSAVLETFSDCRVSKQVTRMGINYGSRYPNEAGDREYWLKKFGLSDADIKRTVTEVLTTQ